MQNNSAIQFVSCTSSYYNQLSGKDPGTLYFLSDVLDICVGSDNYTDVSSLSSRITALESAIAGLVDGDNISYGSGS